MLKRYIGLGLLCFAGTFWVYAQAQGPDYPNIAAQSVQTVTQSESTPSQQPAQSETSTTDDPDTRLYGPEIWRLPPVTAEPAVPSALVISPAETIPTPAPERPPIANAPAALSGRLSLDRPLELVVPEPIKLWDGSFDLGLDGSEGNSETLDFRFGFHASRKVPSNILTLGLDYNKRTAQTLATTNRLFFDGRFEWLIKDSRWSWSVHETIEYDQFQPFNVRDTSDLGLGYRLIKNDATTLIGRFGGGFSHEYGGPQNGEYVPEAVFGMQIEQKISKRQKFYGSVEYAPDVSDFERYRIRTQAALEVLLDEEKHLSLRMGVLRAIQQHAQWRPAQRLGLCHDADLEVLTNPRVATGGMFQRAAKGVDL